MRIPMTLPERHIVDYEWLRDQMISYNAESIFDKLYWEKTDSEDGWRLTGPWKPTEAGYQRVDIRADKYAALREVCGVAGNVFIHRLVSALMYPTPHGCVGNVTDEPTVHHVDEDKLNCAPANLVIITGGENISESRPFGIGFCNVGHPIVGRNIRDNGSIGSGLQCRYCDLTRKRHRDHKVGKTKQVTPMPPFEVWIIAQHATKEDLDMLASHGVPMPGVTA